MAPITREEATILIREMRATARRNVALSVRAALIVGRSEMTLRCSNASLNQSVKHLPWVEEEIDGPGR